MPCVARTVLLVGVALASGLSLSATQNHQSFSNRKAGIHPMLFFGADDVPSLRQKAATTHQKIAEILRTAGRALTSDPALYLPPESAAKFASGWNEVYGNNMATFAMYCVLYPEDEKALELMKVFMDRMASYPDWFVASSRDVDHVPIGHSLAGFATAFDFLYNDLEPEKVENYLERIRAECRILADAVEKNSAGWTRQFIHNHAPTNVLALLLGAMLLEKHEPEGGEATVWKEKAIKHFEKGMLLLAFVVDGTSDEGVAYGSYSSRGWSQYAFLAHRHFGIDHRRHPWFRQHFWFYYATALPGYQRTVGIADSNRNWFYGPESQLHFLDSFVMRNGYGNWLADHIRRSKPERGPLARSAAQKWSTTHTEFIFYDADIKAREPKLPSGGKLHLFSDWGVVTYGGGREQKIGNTFLSLKSGAIHGEAVSIIVEKNMMPSFVKQWKSFNPGHEHPDQNSFVFSPNGREFVTEALYSVKMSHLNNVLTFWPHQESKCNAPWVGQVGECLKWLDYRSIPVPRGRIVTATEQQGFVHIGAESVDAYSRDLGLLSVQRSMVLLHPEVLLILDSVFLKPGSKLRKAGSFFHNINQPFEEFESLGYKGAQIRFKEGAYKVTWFQPGGYSPKAELQQMEIASEYKFRTTHYVNLTFELNRDDVTRIAYLFSGPSTTINDASFRDSVASKDLTQISVTLNDQEYRVSFASLTSSLEARMNFFGFGAFARVLGPNMDVVFGRSEQSVASYDRCEAPNEGTDLTSLTQALISSKIGDDEIAKLTATPFEFNPLWASLMGLGALFVFLYWARRRQFALSKARLLWRWTIFLGVVWLVASYKFFLPDNRTSSCTIPNSIETFFAAEPSTAIVTSLPGSGSNLLGYVFRNSSDYIYVSSDDVTLPSSEYDVTSYDACYWPTTGKEAQRTFAGWFSMMVVEPQLFLDNLKGATKVVAAILRKFKMLSGRTKFALDLRGGFWNTKTAWIHKQNPNDVRFIVVVRDPRDWVYSLVRDDLRPEKKAVQESMLSNLLHFSATACQEPLWLPWEFRGLAEGPPRDRVEHLARLWAADVAASVRLGRSLQVVRFEDLVRKPAFVAGEVMKRLGTTISAPQINALERAVRSEHYNLRHGPVISEASLSDWRRGMTEDDISTVERICGPVMDQFLYER